MSHKLPLRHLDLLVLIRLAEGPSYGYELLRSISKRQLKVSDGLRSSSLYTCLKKLVRLGLVIQQRVPSQKAPDRLVSRLSDKGRRLLTYEIDMYIERDSREESFHLQGYLKVRESLAALRAFRYTLPGI